MVFPNNWIFIYLLFILKSATADLQFSLDAVFTFPEGYVHIPIFLGIVMKHHDLDPNVDGFAPNI